MTQPIPIRPSTEPPPDPVRSARGPGKADRILTVVAWALVAIGLVVVTAGATYFAVINNWLEPLTGTLYTEAEHQVGLEGAQGRGEEEGRLAGLTIGAERGLAVGRQAGEEEGYGLGYAEGEDEGYRRGLTDGYDEGYDVGYQDGRGTGESMGRTTAFDDGYVEGESIGWNEGHAAGVAAGYYKGWSDGCRAVFATIGADQLVDYQDYYWDRDGASYVSQARC